MQISLESRKACALENYLKSRLKMALAHSWKFFGNGTPERGSSVNVQEQMYCNWHMSTNARPCKGDDQWTREIFYTYQFWMERAFHCQADLGPMSWDNRCIVELSIGSVSLSDKMWGQSGRKSKQNCDSYIRILLVQVGFFWLKAQWRPVVVIPGAHRPICTRIWHLLTW